MNRKVAIENIEEEINRLTEQRFEMVCGEDEAARVTVEHNLRDITYDAVPSNEAKVVYQGVPGAYSEQACINFFGDGVNCEGKERFDEVFKAVDSGRADYGVVPIENSSTGAIRQIYDLLDEYDFYIVGETTVKVQHCLMAPYGATTDTIKAVCSHEQGLFQCEKYLDAFPAWERIPMADTAGSAEYVSKQGDITKAAICSRRAAKIYGLEILAENINSNDDNTTRFVVICRRMELSRGRNKISTVFTLPHTSGSLHEILTIFAVSGLNVVRLESRPIQGRSWQYMFFLDFTGDLMREGMDKVLYRLACCTGKFRILGNYVSDIM